jgi:short-subunit dehydrogenase
MPTLAIVGAGPNLGLAAAKRFGAEGFDIGLVSRNAQHLHKLADTLAEQGITTSTEPADLRHPAEATVALAHLADTLGPVDVLLYSPLASVDWIKPVAETSSADMGAALELSVLGAIDAVEAVLPSMRARGKGTLLFTTGGAAVAPNAERASSAVSNAAEVAYARLLYESLGGGGIHVAHTAIVGGLGRDLKHDPDDIAEVLWRQHVERRGFQHVVD